MLNIIKKILTREAVGSRQTPPLFSMLPSHSFFVLLFLYVLETLSVTDIIALLPFVKSIQKQK